MAHCIFRQPNGKYTVWSSTVDSPVFYNATKKEVMKFENLDEYDWECHYRRKETLEDAIDEGDIECCLFNYNMTKEELLDYFKEIKYSGRLYKYAENWEREEEE